MQALQPREDAAVGARLAEPGFGGTTAAKAAEIEVEPRAVEGKPGVGAIVRIVEHPLGEGAHGGEAGVAFGQPELRVGAPEPVGQLPARPLDFGPQGAAQITGQRAKARQDLQATEQIAQILVRRAQQVLADVFEEVHVASQHGDRLFAAGHEVARRLDHGFAEVAHEGTGSPEERFDRTELGQDGVCALGRDLPCPQRPAAPARVADQEGAPPILTGGIDVHRPATVFLKRPAQLRGPRMMKRLEVHQEAPAQLADLPRGEHDVVVPLERAEDLIALTVVEEAFETDEGHHVVADGAAGQEKLRDGSLPLEEGTLVRTSELRLGTAGGAHMHSFAHMESAVHHRQPTMFEGLAHAHGSPAPWAGSRGGVGHDHGAGDALQLSRAVCLERADRLPQPRERRE